MKNKYTKGNLFSRKVLAPSESAVSKTIEEFLTARGIYNDRLNSGKLLVQGASGRGYFVHLCKRGTPDRFFIIDGRIYFCEVKAKGKKPSADQLAKHQELRESGAVVFVADSIDSFITQFENLTQGEK